MPNKRKGKVHQTVVRPAMLYGAELWAPRKSDMDYLKVSEMRMMRWCLGKARKDRIRNDWIKHQLQVMPIEEQVNTARLRWIGHVLRRPADHLTRMAWERSWAKRGRGRPRTTWRQVVEKDLNRRGLNEEDAQDRALWRAKNSGQPRG